MPLFEHFPTGLVLNSGLTTNFKIECDALTSEDWEAIARLVSERIPFRESYGVPRGGVPFHQALMPYATETGDRIIVDDVYTTGGSLEKTKRRLGWSDAVGVVLFSRTIDYPDWVIPVFMVTGRFNNLQW